jgi:hypothetical protein
VNSTDLRLYKPILYSDWRKCFLLGHHACGCVILRATIAEPESSLPKMCAHECSAVYDSPGGLQSFARWRNTVDIKASGFIGKNALYDVEGVLAFSHWLGDTLTKLWQVLTVALVTPFREVGI